MISNIKKGAVLLVMLFISTLGFAQHNNNHIIMDVGASYYKGLEATIAYEHGTSYHHAWEFFGTYHITYEKDSQARHYTKKSFWNDYRTWHIGAAYKPCVLSRRNNHGNLRLGGSFGSNTDRFLGGIHVGYEHTFCLYNGWELFLQFKEEIILPKQRRDLFRTGAAFGVKIPFNLPLTPKTRRF